MMHGFSPYGFSPSPFNSQAGRSRIEAQLERSKFGKPGFPLLFSEREGVQSKKSRGGEEENNTRANVWASFGPVSMVVTWLQANDSRFLSSTILTLEFCKQ